MEEEKKIHKKFPTSGHVQITQKMNRKRGEKKKKQTFFIEKFFNKELNEHKSIPIHPILWENGKILDEIALLVDFFFFFWQTKK